MECIFPLPPCWAYLFNFFTILLSFIFCIFLWLSSNIHLEIFRRVNAIFLKNKISFNLDVTWVLEFCSINSIDTCSVDEGPSHYLVELETSSENWRKWSRSRHHTFQNFLGWTKTCSRQPKCADVIRLRSWNVVPAKKEKVFSPTFLRGKISLKKKSRWKRQVSLCCNRGVGTRMTEPATVVEHESFFWVPSVRHLTFTCSAAVWRRRGDGLLQRLQSIHSHKAKAERKKNHRPAPAFSSSFSKKKKKRRHLRSWNFSFF